MPRPIDFVHDELVRVAKDLGLDPRSSDFTKRLFLGSSEVSKRDLEAYGGFAKLKVDAAHTAGIEPAKDTVASRGVELRNLYVRKLERQAATTDYRTEQLDTCIQRVFSENKIKLSKSHYKKVSKKPTKKIVTLLWSDLHFGVDVKDFETVGASYTWQSAARRLAFLCKEAVDTYGHDENVVLRVVLNGDIIQGVIHLSDHNIKLLTEQLWGASAILVSALDFLKQHFHQIEVVCLPGNHDRVTYKDAGRAISQRWDSHSHSIYMGLKLAFRGCTGLSFDIPTSGIALMRDLDDNIMLATHADCEPDPKNVSKAIDTNGMALKLLKIKEGWHLDKPVSVAMFGHWHTPTVQMLPTGSMLVVNGNLIGPELYGQNALGIYGNTPSQLMFETVKGDPLRNVRVVRVLSADTDESLDKIIPTPVIIEDGRLVI